MTHIEFQRALGSVGTIVHPSKGGIYTRLFRVVGCDLAPDGVNVATLAVESVDRVPEKRNVRDGTVIPEHPAEVFPKLPPSWWRPGTADDGPNRAA